MDDVRFAVVLPVKPLELAKSRLELPPGVRPDLVLAMAADTVSAAIAAARVGGVVVVSDDPRAATVLQRVGARVVPDVPRAGLNAALRHGLAVAGATWPALHLATLSADLPALQPRELDAALGSAAQIDRALVPDHDGVGTTLLTARRGTTLDPAYGPGSRAAHERAGYQVIDVPAGCGLRRDVDTLADLAVASGLGLGDFSSDVIHRVGLSSRLG